jgi:hypothetical protein
LLTVAHFGVVLVRMITLSLDTAVPQSTLTPSPSLVAVALERVAELKREGNRLDEETRAFCTKHAILLNPLRKIRACRAATLGGRAEIDKAWDELELRNRRWAREWAEALDRRAELLKGA